MTAPSARPFSEGSSANRNTRRTLAPGSAGAWGRMSVGAWEREHEGMGGRKSRRRVRSKREGSDGLRNGHRECLSASRPPDVAGMRRSAVDRPRSSLPERIVPGEEVAERKDGPGRELAPVDRHAEAGLDAPRTYLPTQRWESPAPARARHFGARGRSRCGPGGGQTARRPPASTESDPPSRPPPRSRTPSSACPRPPRRRPEPGPVIEGSEGKDRAAIGPGWDAEHPLFRRFRKNAPIREVL